MIIYDNLWYFLIIAKKNNSLKLGYYLIKENYYFLSLKNILNNIKSSRSSLSFEELLSVNKILLLILPDVYYMFSLHKLML